MPLQQSVRQTGQVLLTVLCLLVMGEQLLAQGRVTGTDPRSIGQRKLGVSRTLQLEILMQPQPLYRVRAQEWGRILQELGYSPRFRAPEPGEKMRVEQEQERGRLVTRVVGGMTPTGAITIGGRSYSIADKSALAKVLQNLKESGSSEADGDPRWSLSEQQFDEVRELMQVPMTGVVRISSLGPTLRSLGLPPDLPITYREDAYQKSLAAAPASAPDEIDLDGVSRGTALALLLAQYGLGFRPIMTRDGGYAVEVAIGGEADGLWPVGWRTQESTPDLVPGYLRSIPFSLEDANVQTVLEAVAGHLELPLYEATFALAKADRVPDALVITRDKKMAPFQMLLDVARIHELGFAVRADEAGRIFLWITTAEESAAFEERFAHVRDRR